jgi:hypothetical protein
MRFARLIVPLALVGSWSARAAAQTTDAPAPAPSASAPVPAPAPAPAPAPTSLEEPTTPVEPPAATPPATSAEDERLAGVPDDLQHLILDDGRYAFKKPKEGVIGADIHGELQLRYTNQSALRMTPPIDNPAGAFLDQRNFGTVWLRLGGQLAIQDKLKLVVQLDLLPRWILGDVTYGVSAAGDWARDDRTPSFARLRYAYLDWATPIGLLRVGQMGNNWGMGILANNGDRPMFFGDYRNGSIVERVAFATRPAGKDSPFVIAIAGDAVLQDATAKWSEGDRAYQGVLSVFYEKGENMIGFFGTRRVHKARPEGDDSVTSNVGGHLRVWVADVAGKGATALTDDVYAFGAFEVATIQGKTDAIRSTPEFNEQDIHSWGGAAQVGVVKKAKSSDGVRFGAFVGQVEAGYASGDANPYDGTIKRFTFDPNHQVGLVLFPYYLHFHTAREATNAGDPSLVARPLPGSRFLTSNGGVFGATYINPVVVFRPMPTFDLKAGAVVAIASSDMVDPYRTAIAAGGKGDQSYYGGSPKSRDLGLELDAGFEWRVKLPLATLQLGAQAGVLLPGHAFDDAKGNRA